MVLRCGSQSANQEALCTGDGQLLERGGRFPQQTLQLYPRVLCAARWVVGDAQAGISAAAGVAGGCVAAAAAGGQTQGHDHSQSQCKNSLHASFPPING